MANIARSPSLQKKTESGCKCMLGRGISRGSKTGTTESVVDREVKFGRGFRVPAITALFWDIGGVLLTNAWDRTERAKALEHFQLDPDEFQARHEMVVSSFERGKITLDQYLDSTVFYIPRSFTRDGFRAFMLDSSQPLPSRLPFAQALANSGKYFMGTINNESRELNYYRIEKFALRGIFRVFYSSCFVGLRKPERDIYRTALETTQFPADQCC